MVTIADPWVLVCNPKRANPWHFLRGGETLFDEDDCMREWGTWEEALLWAKANDLSVADHNEDDVRQARANLARERGDDLPLFKWREDAADS